MFTNVFEDIIVVKMTLETLSSALGSEAESWGCFEDIPSPIEVSLERSYQFIFENHNVSLEIAVKKQVLKSKKICNLGNSKQALEIFVSQRLKKLFSNI